MNSITNDKHINFVLENFTNISALDEMVTHAKSKVPDILEKLVHKCIEELGQELDDLNMIIDGDYWYNSALYDTDKESGLFFGCEGGYDYLFDGADQDDAPYLYFAVEIEGVKKRERKAYIDEKFSKIENQKLKSQLRKVGIVAKKKDYDDPELLVYPLYREINLTTIMDKERLVKSVKKAILKFTKSASEAIN